jgi:hypothetical protein
MSMELLVILSLESAPDAKQWQNALDIAKVPIQISDEIGLDNHSGFVPMAVHGDSTGLYFYKTDYNDLTPYLPKPVELDFEDPIVYSLGYEGNPLECAAVFLSASVLTGKFGGKAFETQAGRFMDSAQLREAGEICYTIARQLQAAT